MGRLVYGGRGMTCLIIREHSWVLRWEICMLVPLESGIDFSAGPWRRSNIMQTVW
jgi:hypothetical protein